MWRNREAFPPTSEFTFFDMLTWIFGEVKENKVHFLKGDKAAGYLELERARVRWFLSIDFKDIPNRISKHPENEPTVPLPLMGKKSNSAEVLRTCIRISYEKILKGKGYGLEAARLLHPNRI